MPRQGAGPRRRPDSGRPHLNSACPGRADRLSRARHHLAPAVGQAWTCRPAVLIVIDREVGSMTEFKQIVGRGTRVQRDTKKFYFTLIDSRGATAHFADPDFDGDPVPIYEPGEGDPITPPDDAPISGEGEDAIPPTPAGDETIVDQPACPSRPAMECARSM